MIIDHRTYTLKANVVPAYLKLYEEQGLPLQTLHLGPPLGWYYSEIGELNQIIHLWQYNDYADRQARRANMLADPKWAAFIEVASPFIVKMVNKIVIPAPFLPQK